jgi:DNA-binding CsgD family transcriptional regulator
MGLGARRPDPIRIVEAAYTWEADEGRWLDGVVQAAAGYDVGGGVIAYTIRVGRRTEVGPLRRSEGAADRDALALRRVTKAFPPHLAREICAPTEFVGNTSYRLARLARARGVSLDALTRSGQARIPAMWALVSGDPLRRGLLLCFPRRPERGTGSPDDPFPHSDARSLGLVGAHLGAALRLRALLPPSAAGAEAVLTPGGRVLHAEGQAASAAGRASLVQAVLSSERARGRMRRADPDEALRTWTALVRGHWTILDGVERDGKRLLFARRNPLGAPGLLDLSGDERDVAWLAAMGHSYKYIAYELGLPLGTVSSRLRRAMRKLRVGSHRELLQKLGVSAANHDDGR